MDRLLNAFSSIGTLIIILIGLLIFGSMALMLLGTVALILVWCFPLTVSVLLVVAGGFFLNVDAGRKAGMFVAACAITCFYWAFFVLEPNLERLPSWLLFLLALPPYLAGWIDYAWWGSQAAPRLDMAWLLSGNMALLIRGTVVIVSIAGFVGLVGPLLEGFKRDE